MIKIIVAISLLAIALAWVLVAVISGEWRWLIIPAGVYLIMKGEK